MTSEDVFKYVDAEPFEPFRIRMASGRTFDVWQPRMIRVGANSVFVFEYFQQDERLVEKFQMLGMPLMTSIELIDAPVAQD